MTVTDGSNPLRGASSVVVSVAGTRYAATSTTEGVGVIVGLPDGSYTVYAYEPGYLPATVSATQTGGIGSATIALEAGAISETSATSNPSTYQQIVAAGIDPNDPANQSSSSSP